MINLSRINSSYSHHTHKQRSVAVLAALFVLIAAIASLTISCTQGAASEERERLSVALSGSPETLDPHATTSTLTFQVTRSIYDTLLEPDSDGQLVAALAESWQFSDEAQRLAISLRRGVRFHNGNPLTSTDVKRSLERLQAEQSPRAADYANIIQIELIDDQQLVLQLAQPQSSLLATLASGWSAILPHALIDADHDFATLPVGSGPFSFTQWQMGSRITLERNRNYWRDSPSEAIRIVNFNIITENIIRVQGLLQGSIDVVDLIDPIDIPRLIEDPEIAVDRTLSSLAMVIAVNTADPLLSDVRLRRAISHAIDKQRILDEAYGGGLPITTFIDHSDPYSPAINERYGYDPAAARRLIAQLGGNTTATLADTPLVITVPQNFEPHVRAAELYQQMLSEVGLPSELELIDWPSWITRVYAEADYQLTVIGHTGHLDPAPRFSEYAYTRFTDPALPPLLTAAARSAEREERAALYAEALGIFADALPFIFVGTNYRYIVTRTAVSGVIVDAKLDTFDFRDVVKR